MYSINEMGVRCIRDYLDTESEIIKKKCQEINKGKSYTKARLGIKVNGNKIRHKSRNVWRNGF